MFNPFYRKKFYKYKYSNQSTIESLQRFSIKKANMNISDLLELQKKKAQLQRKKGNMLKKALQNKTLEQINIDQSSVKKGYIQKTKIIKKKQFEVIHQKARTHIPVQIQQNASVSSYLINNASYHKIYERTKKIIQFNDLTQSIAALKSFAENKHEKLLHLKLIFNKEIQCGSAIRPFQLNLTYKNEALNHKKTPIPKAIILVKNVKIVEKSQNFKNLVNEAILLKEYNEFVNEWKHDKQFKKKISSNRILILCDWQIFKVSKKFIEGMLSKNFVIFPFDVKKVPYFVQQKYQKVTYEGYLNLMIQNQYALIKSGKQHTVHLKLSKSSSVEDVAENIKETIMETVAKLIERNKNKSGNYLQKAQIKTNTSINFSLYQK